MTVRRRTRKPQTVAIERVEALFADGIDWFAQWGAARPKKARIWHRHDGGFTIRAVGVTPEGQKVSYTVKVGGR